MDLVVVGGGIAGMTAACRAAQSGLSVLVLERGTDEKYLCNTRYTGGTFHVAMNDVMLGEGELLSAIQKSSDGHADSALAAVVARDAAKAVRWLQSEGMRFMKASASAYHNWVLAPPGRSRPGLDWEGRSGDVLLRTMEANLNKRGGRVQRGARARRLIIQDGAVAGVVAQTVGGETTYPAMAVVVADGGFQGNADFVSRYITPQAEGLKQRGAGTGVGDGLAMALEAGAAISDMGRFYGHILSRDAFRIPTLWPYPYLDAVAVASIVVDTSGRRFVDEGRGGIFIANAIAALQDPLSASLVFDESIWTGPGRSGLIPTNPHLPGQGGTLHKAGSIEELAKAMGAEPAVLRATVDAYNSSLENGETSGLQPPRGNAKGAPMPIRKAPFFAAPVCAGITYTMGGILIDEHARVLDETGKPIAGFYAAGATTGGLEGGPAVGYVGGLIKSTVFGLRAADHAAALAEAA